MARFLPIPVRDLVHTATHIGETGGGAWEEPTKTETTLRRVRFDGRSGLSYAVGGAELQCSFAMYFDCTNSLPQGHGFALGDRIRWNGAEYTIKAIAPRYVDDRGGLHHYELGLV